MKTFTLLFVSACAASPLLTPAGTSQVPFLTSSKFDPKDFNLDLFTKRLVQFEGQEPRWMTELEKIRAKSQGLNFFDITDAPDLGTSASQRLKNKLPLPTPSAISKVKPVLSTLSTQGPKENLQKFTSFRTRYYRSETGKQSQKWLLSRISQITQDFASQSLQNKISISEFDHPWNQNSIIVRINGTSIDESVVIIGAHQDSTNIFPFLPAPGADDDGSGTVSILEAYRALIAADFHPRRPVEFHWYSAEEGGLLGSLAIARDYDQRGVDVLAMSQFDMTAWVKRGSREEVGIITDFTDESVTSFNKELVKLYLDIPYVETRCGYACSDQLRI